MKAFAYVILVLGFSITGCSSQKKLVDNPPFEMGDATCQRWSGGRAESGSGILLQIPFLNDSLDNVKLQQAYFRGKVADITIKSDEDKQIAEANFRNSSKDKPDMVMHSDPKKEVGNQPPELNEKMPFELSPEECVVSYEEDGKLKYYKVQGIKEKKPLIYQ